MGPPRNSSSSATRSGCLTSKWIIRPARLNRYAVSTGCIPISGDLGSTSDTFSIILACEAFRTGGGDPLDEAAPRDHRIHPIWHALAALCIGQIRSLNRSATRIIGCHHDLNSPPSKEGSFKNRAAAMVTLQSRDFFTLLFVRIVKDYNCRRRSSALQSCTPGVKPIQGGDYE